VGSQPTGLGLLHAVGDRPHRPAAEAQDHEEHDHDDFESFVLSVPPIADEKAFAMRVVQAMQVHDVLRAKGFLAVDGKPMRFVVQAVGPRVDSYFDRPWRSGEARQGSLVVIGLKGLDQTAISEMLGGTPQ